MVVCSTNANADAILVLTDTSGGPAKSCNTSMAINVGTNCLIADGFIGAVLGANSIFFTGSIGGFTIVALNIGGNQPGTNVAGNVLNSTFSVLHTAGTGNLQIDYGGNNFNLPAGPGLFLSGSASGTYGQSQATDVMNLQVWGRPDNALIIPGGGLGGATTTASCIPGAGLTTSCDTVTPEVGFVRLATPYALTARQIITQSTLDTLAASYDTSVAANAQPTQVPEPASIVLLGAGLLLLATRRRAWK
jgi:hypothetical protein